MYSCDTWSCTAFRLAIILSLALSLWHFVSQYVLHEKEQQMYNNVSVSTIQIVCGLVMVAFLLSTTEFGFMDAMHVKHTLVFVGLILAFFSSNIVGYFKFDDKVSTAVTWSVDGVRLVAAFGIWMFYYHVLHQAGKDMMLMETVTGLNLSS